MSVVDKVFYGGENERGRGKGIGKCNGMYTLVFHSV